MINSFRNLLRGGAFLCLSCLLLASLVAGCAGPAAPLDP